MARGRNILRSRNGARFLPLRQRVISTGSKLRRFDSTAISADTVSESECGFGDCIGQIREAWAREAQNVLGMAGLMWRIRDLLRRRWSALWRTKNVPFGKRTAEKYVAVGKGFDGISAHDRAQLPPALNTLCCLADLGRKKIEDLIGDGRIHPGLKLREAQALVAGFPPESRHTTSRSKLQRRLDGFAEFVRENLKAWSPKERQMVVERLAALGWEIRAANGKAAASKETRQTHPIRQRL